MHCTVGFLDFLQRPGGRTRLSPGFPRNLQSGGRSDTSSSPGASKGGLGERRLPGALMPGAFQMQLGPWSEL